MKTAHVWRHVHTIPLLLVLLLLASSISTFGTAHAEDSPLSLFRANIPFKDDAGKIFDMRSLAGRPFVLAMAYTNCTYSCPLIMRDMKTIAKELSTAAVPADILVISFDSARDTPQSMAKFRASYGLQTDARWHFLVTDETHVRTLALVLDVRYQRNAETGIIAHDNKIFLVDPRGVIVSTLSALGEDRTAFSAAAKALKAQ